MSKLFKYSLLVLAGLLFAGACEKPLSEADPITLAVRRSNAGPAAGEVFVSVKYAGSWTLSLSGEDGAPVEWAELQDVKGKPLSKGRGEMNNIFLVYELNTSGADRTLNITAVSDRDEEYVVSFTQFLQDVSSNTEDYFPSGWMER